MRKAQADEAIRRLAQEQHGCLTRRQARSEGVTAQQLCVRVETGELVVESATVLRLGGSPNTVSSRLTAAVLDTGGGAVVSHRSAAALWGLPGFELEPVEVLGHRPKTTHRVASLGLVHQPRCVLVHHRVELDHIPVTTPTRMVFDLAGLRSFHPKRLERLLDTCWSRNLVSHRSLERMLADLGRRGRRGIALMRALLADRPTDHRPPESSTEARFQELARAVGLWEFERQVDLGDDDRWIGRVDFVDRRRGLVVEVDTALFHGSLSDQRADLSRRSALERAGLRVVAVAGPDLFHRPGEVKASLRSLLAPALPPTIELAG